MSLLEAIVLGIVQGLSEFIQQNFLSSAAVVERIARALNDERGLPGTQVEPDAMAALGAFTVARNQVVTRLSLGLDP